MVDRHWADVVVTEPVIEPVSLTEAKNRLRISSTADDADLTGLIIAARRQVEKDLGSACLVATTIDHWIDGYTSELAITIPRWPLQSTGLTITSYDEDDAATVLAATEYLVDTVSRPGRVILNSGSSWPSTLRTHKSMVVRHVSGFSGAAKTVSGITRSSTTATATTSTAHGYATGNRITIAGSNQSDYNGTFEITVTGAAAFTFTVANSPTTPATGTMTATDLGIPEQYRLALMVLVAHWWRNREAVLTGTISKEIEFSYWALLSDRVVGLS